MARPKDAKRPVRTFVGAAILPEIDEAITTIARDEGRSKSQVIEKLLQRGLAAYQRDGLLVEIVGKRAVKIADIGDEGAQPEPLKTKQNKSRKN